MFCAELDKWWFLFFSNPKTQLKKHLSKKILAFQEFQQALSSMTLVDLNMALYGCNEEEVEDGLRFLLDKGQGQFSCVLELLQNFGKHFAKNIHCPNE